MQHIKERIEELPKIHHIEILRIFKKYPDITLNENKNGIFINITNLPKNILDELTRYLDYVNVQQNSLEDVEHIKKKYINDFFKDNKDTSEVTIS